MPPTRSTTIEDVARLAGVSRAAVSKVIRDAYGVSPDMRAKVQSAIDQLGYRPRASARAMRGSSYTLGIEMPNIHNLFFPKIITGATQALENTRYQLILAPTGATGEEDHGETIEALVDHGVDGLVAISSRVSLEWLERLAETVPLVVIGRHYDARHFDTIVSDDAAGTALAVQHLYDLGHRRIAHVTLAGPGLEPGAPHQVRLDAYLALMARLGLTPEVIASESSETGAYAAALAWLQTVDEPVGVFAGHDELALGVLTAVAELGRAAGQVSVVGYDDSSIASHPMISLTSVNQSGTQVGARAVRLLLERIAGRTAPAHEVMAPELRVRRSSAAPSGAAPRDPSDDGERLITT
ncbi:MAG: LacI family transcriptional regulator [Propionibacteriaceae bacterium]|nr:LacI family transcriptional regulator [Propionibacteriaceae bacterium]